MDAHVCDLPAEFPSKDGVAITQQVAWELVKWKSLPELLSGPFRCWVRGHIEMENAPAVMRQHQKHVKHLEANRRHGKDRARKNLEEGEPKMRR